MLSRLWYLVLAVALGGALAGAFLNKSAASREADFQLEDALRRDRVEAELWLRLDARLRLDALASVAVEPEVRQTLRGSSGRSGTPAQSTRRRLSQKLNALNAKLEEGKGDLLFAVDNEGEVVATLDKDAMGAESLDKMPIVRDALRGFMRDDVWVYNGNVYRMAARPVFDGGRYVGAVVHGIAVNDELARRLGSKLPNASVLFFFRDRIIAGHAGGAKAPTREELKSGIPTPSDGISDDVESVEIAERTRAVAAPIRGGAAHAHVGYIIGRKGSSVGLGGLFANTFKEDVASLPWLAIICIPLVLLLLGLALLYVEHDKAVRVLRTAGQRLAKGEITGLPEGELRRHYRKLAEHVNAALGAGVGFRADAARRSSVDLDAVLSSTRDSAEGGYFGFPADAPTAKQVALESDLPAKPASQPEAKAAAVPAVSKSTNSPTARPERAPSSRAKRAPSSWPNRRSSQPPPAAVRHGESQLTPMPDDPPTRPNALLDDYDGFDEPEENTQIKHVPQELIEASTTSLSAAAAAPVEESNGDATGEETHFREVFDEFVATQKECGGPVSGLTYDKFVRKLHAAREQVMKRHNAPAVRFTVYVKEGRAALKASPIKQ